MGKSLRFLEILFYDYDSYKGKLMLEYFSYLMICIYFFMLLPCLFLLLYFFETITALIIFLILSCLYLLLYPKYKAYFDFEDL